MNSIRDDEAGVTLIELIVYVVVLGILMSVITMIFVNTWSAQAGVTSQTAATTRGQLVSSEIEKAMRNAIAFTISPDGTTLSVNTSFTSNRQCQNFALKSDGLHMSVSSPPAPITWPVWQDRVSFLGSTPVFKPAGAMGVTYSFASTSDSGPVTFTGTAYMRNSTTGNMGGC
ncbi:Tfp pilus assembly major pilin PilA [Microbacterium trichothecenolyticum]|uniref:pilus assembly FimT family protein n=1 Tax=Microbacterium trichothecenolyticum TaxID=69370 RepID=UPI0028626BC4|nr:prepilin-type N-terminal cleavage/methylation domain-containing protein [Microbacterium trichothecenolyticum]MDR7185775.1 Tfp pilus assembly major pilin PilA [Microbacterium trichothecenolyticum]